MIGFLRGRIKDIDGNSMLIVNNGVGYIVEVANVTGEIDQDIEIYTYTHVREDDLRLFGFNSKEEKSVFTDLIGISGIGPKIAIGILIKVAVKELIGAVVNDNYKSLVEKGITKKTAEKIVLELKNKYKNYTVESSGVETNKIEYLDIIEALSKLGYRKNEIDEALKNINLNLNTGDIIKEALSYLRKR